jgi:hypothetical protein
LKICEANGQGADVDKEIISMSKVEIEEED